MDGRVDGWTGGWLAGYQDPGATGVCMGLLGVPQVLTQCPPRLPPGGMLLAVPHQAPMSYQATPLIWKVGFRRALGIWRNRARAGWAPAVGG